MPQHLPVPRKSLAAFYASHPKYVKSHPAQAKANPKTLAAAKALISKRKTAAGNDPNLFTAPMGTTQATQYADKLAGAQFDPAIRASKFLSDKQIPDWFQQYQNDLHSIQQRQAQNTATATGQIQNFANSSSQVDQGQQAEMQKQMAADAQVRGAQVDPKIALLAQQASASRRAGTDRQGALLATQGAIQGDSLLDKERIAGGDKISKLSEQARVRQGLLTQRGAKKAEVIGTTRENERRNLLERAAFGLNQQKAADSAAAAAAKAKAAADAAAERKRHDKATEHHSAAQDRIAAQKLALDQYKVHHPKTTKGTGGPKAQAKFKQNFQNSYDKIWAHMRAFPNPNRARMLDYALSHAGSGPGAQAGARAAVNRWYTKK